MRSFSGGQANRWALGQTGTNIKVEIDRTGSGSWVDMTALQSRDWVRSVSVEDNVDAATMTASVTFSRSQYLYNLAPLMTASQLNVGGVLVTVYRKIKIWVYISNYGDSTPGQTGAVLLFHGRIFNVNWGSDDMTIEARDFGGDLMDAFIENGKQGYGSTAGVLAETVMQQILTANVAVLPAAVTLYSINGTTGFAGGDSPGWAMKFFTQDMMPIMAALNVISQQIGWILKYRWNASANDFVLTWYDPVRSNTTSLRTFTSAQYYSIGDCSLHMGDIRNYIRVMYKDAEGRDQSEVAFDSTSITLYGRKFMQLAEEAASQIDTSTEALKMANGAKDDLALPTMSHSVEMPLFWPVECGDIYTFAANRAHYDADQKLAVMSYKHMIEGTKSSTSMTLRGKPSGGVRTWFDREAQLSRKKFGVNNLETSTDEANNCPNGTFGQYSKG